MSYLVRNTGIKFLSTPSARRATWSRLTSASVPRNFYPRPPRGGRLFDAIVNEIVKKFLSTPSARRATHPVTPDLSRAKKFRSTPSARRATGRKKQATGMPQEFLSTPSARRATWPPAVARGHPSAFLSTPSARRATALPASAPASDGHFYPRPPRGGRPLTLRAQIAKLRISIHALREEGDGATPVLTPHG